MSCFLTVVPPFAPWTDSGPGNVPVANASRPAARNRTMVLDCTERVRQPRDGRRCYMRESPTARRSHERAGQWPSAPERNEERKRTDMELQDIRDALSRIRSEYTEM